MTSVKNDGYTTEMEYTSGFYRDLTPGILRMSLLLHGVDMPKRKKKEGLRYLELGYGQGISLNIHAAALTGEFWGTDFNPTHTLHAKELAAASGADLHLYNDSFAELAAKSAKGELPQFDIIALHDVWSSVDDVNRGHILSILNRNCKMGGIVYVSYNCLPGWAAMAPLRDMIAMYASLGGSESRPLLQRVGEAYAFTRQLSDTGARYFSTNPQAKAQLEHIGAMPPNYVAHEYCNNAWRPFYFADVARAMGMAKLNFVGSSRPLNEMAAVCLPPEGRQKLLETENPLLRETLRDYYMNQSFRADIFVKGEQSLTPPEQVALLDEMRLALVVHADTVPATVPGPVPGSTEALTLREDIYKPVLTALADKHYAPKSIEALKKHAQLKDMSPAALMEALTVLMGLGFVHPAQDSRSAEKSRAACEKLNLALLQRAVHGEEIPALASPVLGGALLCSSLEQLFILHLLQATDPDLEGQDDEARHKAWAHFALDKLAERGQRLERDGQTLPEDQALEEMTTLAQGFAVLRLPLLKALGIVPAAGHSAAPAEAAEEAASTESAESTESPQ